MASVCEQILFKRIIKFYEKKIRTTDDPADEMSAGKTECQRFVKANNGQCFHKI